MKALSVPFIFVLAAFFGLFELLVRHKSLKYRGEVLPPPDLRRVERGGSTEYFIRAYRGVTRD